MAVGQFREVGPVVSDGDRVLATGGGREGFGSGDFAEEFEDAGGVGRAALDAEEDRGKAGSDLNEFFGSCVRDAPGKMVDEGRGVRAQRVVELDEHCGRSVRDEIETGHACGSTEARGFACASRPQILGEGRKRRGYPQISRIAQMGARRGGSPAEALGARRRGVWRGSYSNSYSCSYSG
jgi:hypothetical protein